MGMTKLWRRECGYLFVTRNGECAVVKQKLFDELIASIEQAGEILREECEPARVTVIECDDFPVYETRNLDAQ